MFHTYSVSVGGRVDHFFSFHSRKITTHLHICRRTSGPENRGFPHSMGNFTPLTTFSGFSWNNLSFSQLSLAQQLRGASGSVKRSSWRSKIPNPIPPLPNSPASPQISLRSFHLLLIFPPSSLGARPAPWTPSSPISSQSAFSSQQQDGQHQSLSSRNWLTPEIE